MMWPFKKKIIEEPKLPELKELRFGGWRYTPLKTIKAYEVALLLPMFINPFWKADYQKHIDDNNLRKHFTKVEYDERKD